MWMTDISQAEIILAGRLDGKQRNRLKRLMDLMYTPRELAEEIGVDKDRIYMVYIKGGCPHVRERNRHIMINGKKFRAWFEEVYAKRDLLPGQAFCLTCKKGVEMVNPERKRKDKLIYALCNCPNCGRRLTRIVDQKKKAK
jgi:hypothetical protein